MISSLKPWVSRFQGALPGGTGNQMEEEENQLGRSPAMGKSVPGVNDDHQDAGSPRRTLMGSMISPSPLVSWRGSCRIERGRQLFLLTPLSVCRQPLSSKYQKQPKAVKFNDETTISSSFTADPPSASADQTEISERGLVSPPTLGRRGPPVLAMTPHFKMSPPKSCVVLEPNTRGRRGGPESPPPFTQGDEDFEDPTAKKELDSSPDWSFSPPKTCLLLELPKEKSKGCAAPDHHPPIHPPPSLDPRTSLILPKKFNGQEASSTPVWKEGGSSFVQGSRPGENTLKKELWTRFEAASTCGLRLNICAPDGPARRGFLDMLDEVSCDAKEALL